MLVAVIAGETFTEIRTKAKAIRLAAAALKKAKPGQKTVSTIFGQDVECLAHLVDG
jgi:hypothetical protein